MKSIKVNDSKAKICFVLEIVCLSLEAVVCLKLFGKVWRNPERILSSPCWRAVRSSIVCFFFCCFDFELFRQLFHRDRWLCYSAPVVV